MGRGLARFRIWSVMRARADMPNDTEAYREDSFDNMKKFAAKHGFTFPYVIDETQAPAG